MIANYRNGTYTSCSVASDHATTLHGANPANEAEPGGTTTGDNTLEALPNGGSLTVANKFSTDPLALNGSPPPLPTGRRRL